MIDKIYVIHYEPLIERKQYLDSILPTLDIPYEYILMNQKTDNAILNNIENYYSCKTKQMSSGEIGISISHLNVYKKILQENYNLCLILEDDAIILDDFLPQLKNSLNELQNFDMTFLSTCCGLRSIGPGKINPSLTTRCTTGYIVKSTCLERILENSTPISDPIDWHLNHIQPVCNLIFGWHEPPLITQGSETVYKSNLRNIS